MAQPKGHQTQYTMYDEDAYGEDPSVPSGVKLYVNSFSVSATQEQQPDEDLGRTQSEPLPGTIDVAGAIPVKVCAESIGKLLKHALGQVATTGTGPYTHAITIGDLPAGFVLEKDYGSAFVSASRYERFNGCRVAGFNFEYAGNAHPTLSFDIKGASQSFNATPLDATPDDLGCTKFSLHHASIEEGGSAAAIIMSATLAYTNGLGEDGYAVGDGGVRSTLDEGQATVSGELTARFADMTLLNKAINSTASSLKFILSMGTGDGSAGNGLLELECAAVKYGRQSPVVEGPHGIMVTLPFTAYGANALKATLKNAVAAL